MKSVIVIPARYGATRFPGKSLARIAGPAHDPVGLGSGDAAAASTEQVVVATDDDRIADVAAKFGADVVMTKKSHRSGTDRMAEVADKIPAQLYVNVQGDEPLLSPGAVDDLIRGMMESPRVPIGTLAHRIEIGGGMAQPGGGQGRLQPPSARRSIFRARRCPSSARSTRRRGCCGMSAFTPSAPRALATFVSLKPSPLEMAESLEQLRALENGLTIQVIETKYRCLGVDTPADLARVEAALRRQAEARSAKRKTRSRKK